MLKEAQEIDSSAIKDLRTIKEEQEVLQSRLDMMTEKQDEVSPQVFERVKADYEDRHAALEEKARPLKEVARAEYAKLSALLTRLEENLELARLAKEEVEFRNELGEFEEDDYQARKEECAQRLQTSEAELAEGNELKAKFLEAFHSEDELLTPPPQEPPLPEEPVGDIPLPEEPVLGLPDSEAIAQEEAVPQEETGEPEIDPESTAEQELPDIPPPPDTGGPDMGEAETGEMYTPTADPTTEPDLEVPGDLAAGASAAEAPPQTPPTVDVAAAAEQMAETSDTMSDGATALMPSARLVAQGADGGEEGFPLRLPITSIGRLETNDISVQDGTVSRYHAKIALSEQGFVITDLDSENGVFVNGERVKERLLSDGDRIELGPGTKRFTFRIQ